MEALLSYRWGAMLPEFIILVVATFLSLLDLFARKTWNRKWFGYIGVVGILLAMISLLLLLNEPPVSILEDTFRLDGFAKAFKLLLLGGAACVMVLASSYEPKEGLTYRGEFYYLLLTALLGAMFMTSSGDLITLFVGLELLSLSSYILAGIRKQQLSSNEAAMKYVINGGIATAITLFGMSYVYGLTGSTNLLEIASQVTFLNGRAYEGMLSLAFLMMLVGLSFKVATVPFHMWAPDVYEGSPIPVTAFLSVISKIAGFALLIRLFFTIFANAPAKEMTTSILESMQGYIGLIAGATMIIGNLVALQQQNIKRLFAYSSVAHAGYLFVALAALSPFMFDAIWFYFLAYIFMNLGAFAVIQLVTIASDSAKITTFSGLYKRSPFLAISMAIFLLSLAGIPGTAGFIGKLNIFVGALSVSSTHYVLVSIMIVTTVISYYYYFTLFVHMFFRPSYESAQIKKPNGLLVSIGLCACFTIILGIVPNIAYTFFFEQFSGFTDFFS